MKNKSIPVKNSNALVTKISANDIYEKLMTSTQYSQSQTKIYNPDYKKSKTQTMFNPKKIRERVIANNTKNSNILYYKLLKLIYNLGAIQEETKSLAIESNQAQGIQYFTLFNKKTQKEYQIKEAKLEKVKKISSEQKPKSSERRIRTWRKENIQLETVLGKLLVSYAQLKPQLVDPYKKWEKGIYIITKI